MSERPNWDELQFVLAVSRSRTLKQAAERLGVTHGTVSRRLAAIERRFGERIFGKDDDGYVPTVLGERLITTATEMEASYSALEREWVGEEPSGPLRVSTISLFVRVLAPALAAFSRTHPRIALQLDTSRLPASLDRNEAQVVIRATDHPLETLVGRFVGRLQFAPYAARSLVEAHGTALADLPWLDWSNSFGRRHLRAYLAAHAPSARIVAELAVFEDMLAVATAGHGVAALPCVDGDEHPDLVRLAPPIDGFSMGIWLLTHPALRGAPRVRAFMQRIGIALDELRPRLEGTVGP